MNGFIEIEEDSYEDTIEHLRRIKILACKLIKMLSEHSEVYDDKEEEEESTSKTRSRKLRNRYDY